MQKTINGLKAERLRHKKAHQTAVKVNGYKLMQMLRQEIRSGSPGGQSFAPLSVIQRTLRATKRGTLAADRPLAALAKSVGYITDYSGPQFSVTVGFGHARIIKIASNTWRRLAKMHQEGFTTDVDAPFFRKHSISIEQYLRQQGSLIDHRLFGRKKGRRRNVFFLKKSTRTFRTPARQIIEPFIRAHRSDTLAGIRRDFIRKLNGERI